MKKPNLFIIGAPKSGTSALAAYLGQHPNVFMCQPKEPFYWSFDYPGLQNILGLRDVQDYLALYDSSTNEHQILGEGSTNYLRSDCAIQNVMRFNPEARLIAMIRNPVDVVHAYHSENLFACWEDEPDFETAWRKQDDRARGQFIPRQCPAVQLLQYRQIASYAEQIERFFACVPKEQRRVIVFDDFTTDTRDVYNRAVDFLGIAEFEMESFERVNAAHGHRFGWLSRAILDPPGPLKHFVNPLRDYLRKFQGGWVQKAKLAMRKPQQRQPMSPEFRAELNDYFRPDVQRLSELLERDLDHWIDGSVNLTPQKKAIAPGSAQTQSFKNNPSKPQTSPVSSNVNPRPERVAVKRSVQ